MVKMSYANHHAAKLPTDLCCSIVASIVSDNRNVNRTVLPYGVIGPLHRLLGVEARHDDGDFGVAAHGCRKSGNYWTDDFLATIATIGPRLTAELQIVSRTPAGSKRQAAMA